jgi:hypothetical protein
LKCGTDYEFKVRAVNKDGDEGPFSPKLKMSTKISLAKTIQLDAKKIRNGNPSVFKLPLFESRDATNFKFQISKRKLGNVLLASIFIPIAICCCCLIYSVVYFCFSF